MAGGALSNAVGQVVSSLNGTGFVIDKVRGLMGLRAHAPRHSRSDVLAAW